MTIRNIYRLGQAIGTTVTLAVVGFIVWFVRESFREFDEVFIDPEQEAW